jgi:endonuclease/exonuclease/phosphatase family metal-dependent hydrolase
MRRSLPDVTATGKESPRGGPQPRAGWRGRDPLRRPAPAALLKFALAALLPFSAVPARAAASGRTRGPEPLTYEELVRLYESETPPAPLAGKLRSLLTTPFVSNEATERGARPLKPRSERLGPFLRVAFWNIERGLEFEAVQSALTDPSSFVELVDGEEHAEGSEKLSEVMEQAALLREADLVILNEVDWGLKRTGYRNVAAELAAALGMNYAYGVEFVEVDPLSLGIENFGEMDAEERAAWVEQTRVDTARYRGLHGTAILSRFPLENVRVVPFENQPHDWYADEKKEVSPVEKGKRKAGEIAFQEKVRREVRRGGRMMLLAEIADPEIPGGRATVVATHLEAKTKPSNRVRQLRELLAAVKDISHPVILAGDMNTSGRDSTPTSVGREIKKRLGSKKFWLTRGLKYAAGLELPYGLVRGGLNEYRKQADPTVRHVPFIAPNPEAKFFETLKEFRFADGGAFDFRGDAGRSAGGSTGTLANSNERGGKGFITTYEAERAIGFVGKFKLDWVFVKPPAPARGEAESRPYRFAPHFGRTLKRLNHSVEGRVSDHSPLVVDLPYAEPPID